MKLIQVLLPLYNSHNKLFPEKLYAELKFELTEKFGGITTYSRSPAKGLWKEDGSTLVKDDIIIYEIMVDEFDTSWWTAFNSSVETLFQQDKIIIRSWTIDVL